MSEHVEKSGELSGIPLSPSVKLLKARKKALMSEDMRHRRTRDMKEECERLCGGAVWRGVECDVMRNAVTDSLQHFSNHYNFEE